MNRDIYKYTKAKNLYWNGYQWDKLNSQKRKRVIKNIVLGYTFSLSPEEREMLQRVMLASVEMFHPVAIVEQRELEEEQARIVHKEKLKEIWTGNKKDEGLVKMEDV